MLRPGQPAQDGKAATSDTWYEFNSDEALAAETVTRPDPAVKTRLDLKDAHLLFITVDDNETPGIPEDDRIIVGDSRPTSPEGVIRILDASNVIKSLQAGTTIPTSTTSPVQSIRVPNIPGASGEFAATSQTFVDREGNVFFIDTSGGVGRFRPDDPLLDSGKTAPQIQAKIATFPGSPVTVSSLAMTRIAGALVPVMVHPVANMLTTDTNTLDRSPATGIDEYELAVTAQRGRNGKAGPFARDKCNQRYLQAYRKVIPLRPLFSPKPPASKWIQLLARRIWPLERCEEEWRFPWTEPAA